MSDNIKLRDYFGYRGVSLANPDTGVDDGVNVWVTFSKRNNSEFTVTAERLLCDYQEVSALPVREQGKSVRQVMQNGIVFAARAVDGNTQQQTFTAIVDRVVREGFPSRAL
ncbi:MAG: hypothetical protein AAF549_03445 [Pseudomonadota bacterium]